MSHYYDAYMYCNIWRSVHEKVKQHWDWVEKSIAYKKKRGMSLKRAMTEHSANCGLKVILWGIILRRPISKKIY